MTPATIDNCQKLLEEVARKGERLTYGALMSKLQIGRQQIAECLNPIYEQEIRAGHSDLTLIIHYSNSPFGLYNSRGAGAQSVKVKPGNLQQVRNYKADLLKVYQERSVQPVAKWKRWLES